MHVKNALQELKSMCCIKNANRNKICFVKDKKKFITKLSIFHKNNPLFFKEVLKSN